MLASRIAALPVVSNQEGTLRVRGTRIPLHVILSAYEQGLSPEEIVEQYPSLKLGDVYILVGYYLLQSPQVRDELRREPNGSPEELERPRTSPDPERTQRLRDDLRERQFRALVDLWSQYVDVRRKLRRAEFARSNKPAEAELAEWLVQYVFEGEALPGKSNPMYDVVAGDMRIEVKSLSKDEGNPRGYEIKPKDRRNDPAQGATHYAFVFFRTFMPDAIYVVPALVVREFPRPELKRADLEKMPGARVDFDLTPFADALTNR